jgi:hypothetical protein
MTRVVAILGGTLATLALCLGASLTISSSSARATTSNTVAAPGQRARVARTATLNESGHLHLTSKHNFTLNEVGSASGTAVGTIYVHLTAVSSSRVTVEVEIYPHGGSLSGRGSASYTRAGALASFSGAMTIVGGTGSYAHVHGSGLSFNGTIAESNDDAITVHVSGRVSN